MFFEIDVKRLPDVMNIYSAKRMDTWQIFDNDTLLIFVCNGNCEIVADNCKHILAPGSLFVVPARHHCVCKPAENEICTFYYAHLRLHTELHPLNVAEARLYATEVRERRRWAMMNAAVNTEINHKYLIGEYTDLSPRIDEATSLFDEAIEENQRNNPDSPTLESMLVTKILLIASEQVYKMFRVQISLTGSEEPPHTDLRHKLYKVLSYIRLHGKENITLDDLCAICNFSKQHLIRVFNAEFGITPKAYVLKHRINLAKELFYRNPHFTVREVADEMGFEDQHYFSRIFTKISGTTPSDYKRNLMYFESPQ